MSTSVLFRMVARVLWLPALIVAAALLVKGASHVGDGFSAGAVAGAGYIIQAQAFGGTEAARLVSRRAGLLLIAGGLLMILLIGFVPALLPAGAPVTHFPRPGEPTTRLGTLEMHTALLFDLGILLLVFGGTVLLVQILTPAPRAPKRTRT